jgi:hypothetical protein
MNSTTLSALCMLTAVTLLVAAPVRAQSPIHLWSQAYGDGVEQDVTSVASDASGNVIITGNFFGTVSFGGVALAAAGLNDVVLAKYSSNGAHLWSKSFGSANNDTGNAVAVDAAGNVYLLATCFGNVDFGGGLLTIGGGNDIFLVKFDASGTHLWSQRFGDSSLQFGKDIAVDAVGDVAITGQFMSTVDFGGGVLTSGGGMDAYLAKFSGAAGTHLWSQRFGDGSTQAGNGVAFDAAGDVVITGELQGSADFGGGTLSSTGSQDVFVAKYTSGGAHAWSQRFGDTSAQLGWKIATDASSNVVIAGSLQGEIDFGDGTLTSAGSQDVFIAQFGAGGVHNWSRRYGSTLTDAGLSVACDAASNVLVAGYFSGSVSFGGGLLVGVGNEAFIARYHSDGTHAWSQRFGDGSSQIAYDVAIGGTGNVAVGVRFIGTVDFGGGVLTSAGVNDVAIANFSHGASSPAISSIEDLGNDQGRQVTIAFHASGFDHSLESDPVAQYEAFRRADAPPAAPIVGAASPIAPDGMLSEPGLLADGWVFVGAVPPHGELNYLLIAPTIGDSTIAMGQYRSTFFIRAATASPFVFYDSPPDSGYSLDNLSPGVPENFAFSAGQLSWDESPVLDFDYFTVYGSNANSFGAATVVDYSVAPAMDVNASPYVFYYVTATDFSGNESRPATVNTLSKVGGAPTRYALSVSNYPNPFNPRTTVSYTVPARGKVTVSIHDARGARIATLVSGVERDAGAYTADWNGRTDRGSVVASGVYFARIEHNGAMRAKKMVLLK